MWQWQFFETNRLRKHGLELGALFVSSLLFISGVQAQFTVLGTESEEEVLLETLIFKFPLGRL